MIPPEEDVEEDAQAQAQGRFSLGVNSHAEYLETALRIAGADLPRKGVHVCRAELLEAGRHDLRASGTAGWPGSSALPEQSAQRNLRG